MATNILGIGGIGMVTTMPELYIWYIYTHSRKRNILIHCQKGIAAVTTNVRTLTRFDIKTIFLVEERKPCYIESAIALVWWIFSKILDPLLVTLTDNQTTVTLYPWVMLHVFELDLCACITKK